MKYIDGLSYSDNVFIRAVELGCEPARAPYPQMLGSWICICHDSEHTAESDHTITLWKLDQLEKSA